MTVQNNLNKHIYTGDGVITEFPYTFILHHESHMKVYVVDTEGTETLLEGNYEVDMYHNNVIYPLSGDPLPPGHRLILYREVPVTQEMDLTNQGAMPNETLERAYDRLTLIAQQHDEAIKRSLKASLAHPGGVFDWPVPAPGKSVGWNEDGTGMANYDNPGAASGIAREAADRAVVAAERAEIAADTVTDATHEATPNALIRRAANGTAKVAAPVEEDDIARKAEVDALLGGKSLVLIASGQALKIPTKGSVNIELPDSASGDFLIPFLNTANSAVYCRLYREGLSTKFTLKIFNDDIVIEQSPYYTVYALR